MDQIAAHADDASARHLLHNLRNAKALRQNPLVANLLRPEEGRPDAPPISERVVLSRVAQAVAAVLRTLAPAEGNPFDDDRRHRQAEIVRRCVLGTEPYKAVAHDLGISLRTLFRDLDGIRLRLADELPRYVPPAPAIVAADAFDLELRRAALLRNMGRFDEALASLDSLARDVDTPLQQARAWNARTVTLVDSGATERAAAMLVQASAVADRADAADTATVLLRGDIELTAAMLARVTGDTQNAIASYARAAELVRPLMVDQPARATDVFVRALANSAIIHWLTGRIDESAAAVERGWSALERIPDPSEAAHYTLLNASALVRLVKDGDVAWAIREMSAAAVIAERHGMLHDALMALGWLSGLERMNGNLAGSVATGRRTIAMARTTMTATEFGLLCAAQAENEAEFGDAAGALRLVEEGRSRVAPGGSGWARLQLAEAAARFAAGDDARAVEAAEIAADGMRRQGKTGFVGFAYLIKAQAHEHAGRRAEAVLAVRQSLALLESFGKSPELAAAYDLSARLTGDRGHRAIARDLAHLLGG